jgi:hypothetical protein
MSDISGEVLDEMGDTLPLLAAQLGLFNILYLFNLRFRKVNLGITHGQKNTYDMTIKDTL